MKHVKIEVISQKGHCAMGHKVGDTWTVGYETPASMCSAAYHVLYPDIYALFLEVKPPWAKPDGSLEHPCTDVENPVIFKIQALDE